MPPRLLLLDPEELVRHAIAQLLLSTHNFQIVGMANDAEEALAAIDKNPIAAVILEIALPHASGINFLHERVRRKIAVRSIVLSHIDSPDMITQAFLAGANGYVLKRGKFEDLTAALQMVTTSNKKFLPPQINELATVTENEYALSGKSPTTDPLSPLSTREREIFHLLASGLQNTTIAKKLLISPRTVETHRARIVRKLGLHTNGELIRFAIKHGLAVP